MASLVNSMSTFDGSNVRYFIKQFNDIANLEKWNAERKNVVFKLLCKGKALEYIINDPVASKTDDFEVLQELVKQKFTQSESFELIQEKFSSIKQKSDQRVKDLAEEISASAYKYLDLGASQDPSFIKLAENIKLTKFLDALRGDIRIEVKKLGPKNFESAVKIASNVESALDDADKQSDESNAKFEINALMQQTLQQKNELAQMAEKLNKLSSSVVPIGVLNDSNTSTSTSNQMDSEIRCHICFKRHITTQCWYFPKPNVNNDIRGNHSVSNNQNFYRRQQGRFNHPYRGPRQFFNSRGSNRAGNNFKYNNSNDKFLKNKHPKNV